MFVPWLEPSSFCRSALELFDSGCQPEQLISHDTNKPYLQCARENEGGDHGDDLVAATIGYKGTSSSCYDADCSMAKGCC